MAKQRKEQFSKASLVALWAVQGIGRVGFLRCLDAQKKGELSDDEFWDNKGQIWQAAALTKKQVIAIKNFKKEHNFIDYKQALKSSGVRAITFHDSYYPALLKMTPDFPPVIFVKSQQPLKTFTLNQLCLAVVGTRKITSYGRLVIKTLLKEILLDSKATLVSGFMYGVDVEAMKIAYPMTNVIGVLGYGFDFCYPRHQRDLMQAMLETGATFLSEYPPEVEAQSGNFVERNRIIAGLCQAVLVVEAALRSGSHITARNALDYGRQVLAVPGPINNPYTQGTKKLLQEGAALIATLEDFWEALESDFLTQVFAEKRKQSIKIKEEIIH